VSLLLVGAGSVALAAGDEKRATEAMIAAAERDPAHKAVTQDLVKRARDASERAARMRAASDEAHARIADGLAREWAEAAQDLGRAADAEAKSRAARYAALDAGVHAERERALLEEGIAHNGRLRAQIDQIDREKSEQPSRTSAAGGSSLDAGADAARKIKGAPTDAGADQ